MFDTCTITRHGARPSFNATTGVTTPAARTSVYSGRCKVQSRTLVSSTSEVGGQLVGVQVLEVHVPISVDDVQVDDVVAITAAELDTALVGRSYRVTAVPAKSFATARRLRCEETTSG
ncbi:MAG: hypothetical protein JWN67_5034 [Actinomycetia bacterium]|nr:hypothetical protein [Actinomycetes bacterium]